VRTGKEKPMSATATMEIGSDLWNARVYAGLSQASELAAELNRPRFLVSLLFFNLKVCIQLEWMNRGLGQIFDYQDQLVMRLHAVTSARILAPEDYHALRDDILRWYAVNMRLLSQQDNFPRNAFMRKRLALFQANSERLLDLADWFDAMSAPEEMDARFKALAEDVAEGNFVPLASVQ
jgi:hypothetical protein